MDNVKVSVCIPVYNGEAFIAAAIDSVLQQTYRDFEIVVVDNQSTDNTISIVKKYADPRIRLIKNDTNIGMIPNWNKAMNEARGTYIKILPADDYIYPTCLELQTTVLENDIAKKISLVCGRKHIIDEKGKVLFDRGFTKKAVQVSGIAAINKVSAAGGNLIGEGGAVLFRKELLQQTGNFNSDIFYVLDLDLWFKMLLHGDLYALPQVVAAFRVSKQSASVQVVEQQRDDVTRFITKIYNDKRYGLTLANYRIGCLKAALLTQAKKILYKYVL